MALFGLIKSKSDEEQEPEFIDSPLRTPMLNYRTYVMSPLEKLAVRSVCFVVGGIIGLIFFSGQFKVDGEGTIMTIVADVGVFILLGLLGNKLFLPIYLDTRLESRKVALSHQFLDMLDALTSAFSAGSNITMAFRSAYDDLIQQYEEDDFIIRELSEILAAERQGFDIADCLRNFAERSGDDDIVSFADVFEIAARQGGSPTAVIRRVRTVLVDKSEVADEIRTKLTSNKTQLNVMTVMPFLIMLYLRFSNETFAENLVTPIGVFCCIMALIVIGAAYRMGQKIVNIRV